MVVKKWHLCIYLFFILLSCQSNSVHSIQCCTGDNTCSAKPVDCPSNACFKIVLTTGNEDRGCMRDLVELLQGPNKDSVNSNFDGGSSSDQCQQLNNQGTGMSLCQCTGNLCNSSSKYSYFSFPVWIFIFFVVYQFPYLFF